MSMSYKGKLNYRLDENGQVALRRLDVPVQIFEVKGGADRSVKLNSSDDISVSSELEQARRFKNVILYLPPSKDGTDMEVLLELNTFFTQQLELGMRFIVERYNNGKKIEGLALMEQAASVKVAPYLAGNRLLTVHLHLPKAKLYRGAINGTSMSNPIEM